MNPTPDGIEQADDFVLTSRKIASASEGFDPRSPYVERFWLPFLGPSTTLLLRHLVWQLESHGEGVTVRGVEMAKAIGLGERPGRHAPFLRAIRRAASFDLLLVQADGPNATPVESDETVHGPSRIALRVRRSLPRLPDRLSDRLSPELLLEHAAILERGPDDPARMRRAQQLARTLADLGESDDDVLSQLVAWQIEPDLARRAVLRAFTMAG